MFYLRILHGGNKVNVENICLGNSYRKVISGFKCEENWIAKPRKDHPRCGMFIFPEVGEAIPIYDGNQSYIVIDSGATYEKLNPVDLIQQSINSYDRGLKSEIGTSEFPEVALCGNKYYDKK